MKKMHFLSLALTLLTVNIAFAADEIHFTVTGQDSVTFDWRGTTTEKSIGYGVTSGVYTQVTATTPNPVPVSSSGPFWEAKLTGLAANTRYYYKIGAAPERSFRTPPAPGSSGFNVYTQGNIGSSSTYFNTGAVQDLIANDLPSFVVGLGDLTLGKVNGKATIDQHFNDVMVWSKEAAYMPVWGDRDTVSSTNESFKNYKGRFAVPNPQTSPGSPLAGGEDWYWFDYGNVRFITMPEPWSGAWADWNTKAGTLMAQAQANANIKFIVTFVHRPAYSSGHTRGSSTLKGILDKLGDTYSKYKLNINAHSNNYERSLPQHGVIHVTAGTGGANLTQDGTCLWLTCAKPDWSAFRAMHLGALKLHFNANGIEGSFFCGPAGGGTNDVTCSKGSVIDSFIIGLPEITSVAATDITPTTVNVTWTLSQPMTGQVEYGTTKSYGQMSVKETSFNYSTHIQSLSGLAPGTTYHFRVRSTNKVGVESVSGDFTFITTTVGKTLSCAPAPTSSLVINVIDKGATGNGSTNDTAAIQAAVDQVAGTGGTVFVPDGTYMIDAITHVNLKSNMTLSMSSKAVLKAIPNNQENYRIVSIRGASNVNVIGGTLQGERNEHIGTTGEWGFGIEVIGSNTVVIEGVTSRDNWGDGFYAGGLQGTHNTTFCSVIADNNRRQGLSIVAGDVIVVKNSVFKNTNGTYPYAGIDIEPDGSGTVNNVKITNSEFFNNHGNGIRLTGQPASTISNVTVDKNTIYNNGTINQIEGGIDIDSMVSPAIITNNTIYDNAQVGIQVYNNAKGHFISNNTVTHNGLLYSTSICNGSGVCLKSGSTQNTVTGNIVTENIRRNIYDMGTGNLIQ